MQRSLLSQRLCDLKLIISRNPNGKNSLGTGFASVFEIKFVTTYTVVRFFLGGGDMFL
jgi:hypothetical protein